MPTWLVVLLVAILWLGVAVGAGLVLGAVIRRRDREVGRPDSDPD